MVVLIFQYSHKVFSFNNMEKVIKVKEVNSCSLNKLNGEEINNLLNSCNIEYNSIDVINWPNFSSYKASVKFRIGYSDLNKEIYLQYVVQENDIKATDANDKGTPYKDSCVEFFSIPGNDSIYYNLEMNCIGKGTFAGGAERKERTRYQDDILKCIRRYPSLPQEAFGIKTFEDNGNKQYNWSLTIAIPYKVFTLSNISTLKGKEIKANFYKCGDDMPQRHYISWNPIGTESPNFHTPQYFGKLIFE